MRGLPRGRRARPRRLDARPVAQWAAGAGIDAVLEWDEDAFDALFEADDLDTMAEALGPGADVNHRELPVAMQFPDWNDWLPEIHPLDIFGPAFEEPGYDVGSAAPYEVYQDVRALLEAGDLEGGLSRLDFFAGRIHGHAGGQIKSNDGFEMASEGTVVMRNEGDELVAVTADGEIRTSREVANRASGTGPP